MVAGDLGVVGVLRSEGPGEQGVQAAPVADLEACCDGLGDQVVRSGPAALASRTSPASASPESASSAVRGSSPAASARVEAGASRASRANAWVVGQDPVVVVDWWGASDYAKS
jgi:hypothetical protein